MRRSLLFLMTTLAVVAAAAAASATVWLDFTGSADCTGYAVSGTASFPNPAARSTADADYVITLAQGGVTVASVSGIVTLTATAPTFTLNAPWGVPLCGDYTASGRFHLQTPDNSTGTFAAAFTCDCPPPPDGCHYTPGYWKNHEEMWPVSSLALGDVTYSQDQALAIMDTPVTGDITIILAYHLIAAKLNVASGASPSIDGAIAAADAFLVAHPLYSRPKGAAKAEGEAIKNELAAYNEIGCPGDLSSPESVAAKSMAPTMDEATTWGSLKSSYK